MPCTEAKYVVISSGTSGIKFVTSGLGEVLGKPSPLPPYSSKTKLGQWANSTRAENPSDNQLRE